MWTKALKHSKPHFMKVHYSIRPRFFTSEGVPMRFEPISQLDVFPRRGASREDIKLR